MIHTNHEKPCKGHNGKCYKSISEMCASWGIKPETYTRRVKFYKMSIEEALTRPVKHNGGIVCYDHQGQRFRSRTYMCKYWHIERKQFEYRIAHG